MCGVCGLLCGSEESLVAPELLEGLSMLQHRGQDAAGIMTCAKGGTVYQCRGKGLVRDVFTQTRVHQLQGHFGIAHTRYPTAGTTATAESQPFYVNSPYGICLAHNGNLTNTEELSDFLKNKAHRHVNTHSDSEALLNIFAHELLTTDKRRIDHHDVFMAVAKVHQRCKGAYAVVLLIAGYGIIAFRDPHGIRPLVFGSRPNTHNSSRNDYIVASESVVLDLLNFPVSSQSSVCPGECVIIEKDTNAVHRRVCAPQTTLTPCIFEYVYFARPDSILNGVSVYRARLAMGVALARKLRAQGGDVLTADVVVPVPDTSRPSAMQLAHELGLPFREGFIKNRYIGRTFIMPGQKERRHAVRRKLNPMAMEFAGKNVLLVDDSIVRGTTAREIVSMVRECGAKKVFLASCSPEIRFPNVYGIDMPVATELVAHGRTGEEIAQAIGADGVYFQNLSDLEESCRQFNRDITSFDTSVFDGNYVTGNVDAAYFDALAEKRRDLSGEKKQVVVDVTDESAKVEQGQGKEKAEAKATTGALDRDDSKEVSIYNIGNE